jgi:hypothetical protein
MNWLLRKLKPSVGIDYAFRLHKLRRCYAKCDKAAGLAHLCLIIAKTIILKNYIGHKMYYSFLHNVSSKHVLLQ